MKDFDYILVGTGQATATLLSGLPQDASIAVIEGDKIGGTCVNTGCTPTKTLVASAKVAHMARRAAEYGINVGEVSVDFTKVMARMNKVRGDSNQGLASWLESETRVSLFRGWAKFTAPKEIQINNEVIRGKTIFLNVGGRPRKPNIPGLDSVPWLDNSRLLELTEVPEHLIVVGGSYIALEFSQMFRRFGADVTVVERSEEIMGREDADVAQAARKIMAAEGIHFELGARVSQVAPSSSGGIELNLEVSSDTNGNDTKTLTGSHVLLATGRVPNTDGLAVEKTRLELDDRGYVVVDDYLRTSVDGVFALGDVNGQGAFTHTSVNDAEVVLDYLKGGSRKLSDRIPIYALFIDPPLGRVGLTEKEALAKGYRLLKATRSMADISRAKEMSETKGFVKLLVDADTDLILGASILGVGGDEIINMFAAIMQSGLPCRNFRRTVMVHPTVSELMPWILDNLEPVHV